MRIRTNQPDFVAAGPAPTAVLLEVLRQDRPSFPTIAAAVGCTRSTLYGHLHTLRALGLVDWRDGTQGTIRAVCRPVPFGPDHGPG